MIGIIAAMKHEAELIKDQLENLCQEKLCGIDFYSGKINGKDVVVSICGVGKVNAASAAVIMILHYEATLLINTGIAGGISGVESRDVIIASKLMYYDFDTTCFGYKLGQVPGLPVYYAPSYDLLIRIKTILKNLNIAYKEATVLSGDKFINTKASINNSLLKDNTNIVCEMEGVGVAQAACKASIPFIVLRYVSDIVDSPSQLSDYALFEKETAEKSASICLDIINNL